jgi:hypothetical protein
VRQRALGLALFAALALHALDKGWALLPEMLWVCHVASAILAAGLLVRARWLVAIGFLLHVAVGLPSFLLDVAFGAVPTPTSWLVHLLAPGAGYFALRRSGLPPRTWLAAWAVFLGTFAVSVLATPPELNVNLVHAAWPPLTELLPSPWAVRALNAGGALAFLLGAQYLLRFAWPAGVRGAAAPPPHLRSGP